MSSNYLGLRKSLESSTSVAKQANDIQAKAASDSKADLEAEHNKHEQLRQELLTKVDQLQTDNDKKTTQIANLETQYRQLKDESDRKLELANAIIREQRDVLDKNENVLDKPDGYITFVDLDTQRSSGQHQPPPGCSPADEDDGLQRRLAGCSDREAQG